MTTVSELVRDVLASIATDAGGVACAKWIDNRYREAMSRTRPRHLREVGELSLPALVPSSSEDSTVTCTRGSTAVAGTDSTWETSPTTSPGDEWYFRARTAWYRIASVTDDENLVLDSAFAEDDVTDGTYSIVKRNHILPSGVRWLGDFYLTRLRKRLNPAPLSALNIRAPGRPLVGNIPHTVSQLGVDATNGYLTVEVYPPPKTTEILHYVYWAAPTTLTLSSNIPPVIEPEALKEGTLIDLYRWEKAQALRKGNIEAAGMWRNEEKAQMTIWRGKISDLIKTSRGVDDVTFILDMFPGGGYGGGDVRTARDQVYSEWSR